jgi:hypothetical protein
MIFLPGRPLEETIKRLTPLLNDPGLEKKVSNAARQTQPAGNMLTDQEKSANKTTTTLHLHDAKGNTAMLAQVAGVIIGSPEFQRK